MAMRALLALLLFACVQGAHAAYCFGTFTSGGKTYFVAATQPADPSTCAYIALSGTEWASYQSAITTNTNQTNQISALQSSQATQDTNIANAQSQITALNNALSNLNIGLNAPFDYTFAAGVFALFFTSVVGLWWVAKSAGVVLEAIRKW